MATWVFPVTGVVGDGPGPRASPGGIGSTNHGGWDIKRNGGTPIVSATDGTVIGSGWSNGYGNLVTVRNSDGSISKYGHMASRDVSVGDSVSAGDNLGVVGTTGRSTGPHLHYERRDANGRLLDPTGDESLNGAFSKRGSTMKAGQKGDGTPVDPNKKNDGKKGEGEGDPSKKSDHDKRSKEKNPPGKTDHKDIKGKAGSYEKTTNSSIVSRMPTHEPWPGHPKSTEGPRQAVRADGGANNSGGGTGGSGGGGGTSSGGGGGGGGGTGSGGGGGGGTGGGGGGGGGTGGGGGGGGGTPNSNTGASSFSSAEGQQRGEQIYNRLIQKGWSPTAASASVGNFMGEGLNKLGAYGTNIKSDPSMSGKPGYSRGVGQWRNERGQALENFANGNNPSGTKYSGGWQSMEAQADFYDYEMKTKFPGLYNRIKTSNDQNYVVDRLVEEYEMPGHSLRAKAKQQRNAYTNGFNNKKNARPRTADNGGNAQQGNQAPKPSNEGGGSSAKPAAEAKS